MARKSLKNIVKLIDAAKDELPMEQSFLNDLEYSIKMNDQKDSRKPSQSYKPSSLGCIRNMFYQVTGAETSGGETTPSLVGICESGTDRHERIQNGVSRMKENGIDCEYVDVGEYVESRHLDDIEVVAKQGNETKLFNKRLNMSFLCDGIIRYKGHYYILEIKTETSYKWTSRNGVNPDHVLQGTAYSLNLGLNEVLFLYECRDNCMKKTYILNVTDDMKIDLESRIMECDKYVLEQCLPPMPDPLPKHSCQYCDYRTLCINNKLKGDS